MHVPHELGAQTEEMAGYKDGSPKFEDGAPQTQHTLDLMYVLYCKQCHYLTPRPWSKSSMPEKVIEKNIVLFAVPKKGRRDCPEHGAGFQSSYA